MLPPAGLFLLFGFGKLVGQTRSVLGARICTVAVTALYLVSTGLVSNLLVRSLESRTAPVSLQAASDAQAIVVLAAGRIRNAVEYQDQDVPDELSMVRLRYAAYLHREITHPILISGGFGTREDEAESLAFLMQRVLLRDFRISARWLEQSSINTESNAILSADILRASGLKRIVLVTDAMHMHRASLLFQNNGVDVVEAPTYFLNRKDTRFTDLLPSAGGLFRSYYALYQWLGIAWFKIRDRFSRWSHGTTTSVAA